MHLCVCVSLLGDRGSKSRQGDTAGRKARLSDRGSKSRLSDTACCVDELRRTTTWQARSYDSSVSG